MTTEIEFETVEATCPTCGATSERTKTTILGKSVFAGGDCESCHNAKAEAGRAAELAEKAADKIKATIPKRYQDNDTSRFPAAWQIVSKWTPDAAGGVGMMLAGQTAKCKTRMLCELLGRLISKGQFSLDFLRCGEYARTYRAQYSHDQRTAAIAADRLAYMRKCRVLALDDVGKENDTEGFQADLFDLLDERISEMRPTLITLNATADELKAQMSDDRGEPFVRRLREFCEFVLVN